MVFRFARHAARCESSRDLTMLGLMNAVMNGTTENNTNTTISTIRPPIARRVVDRFCATVEVRGGSGACGARTRGDGGARMGWPHLGHMSMVSLTSRPQSGHLIKGISRFE